MTKTLFFACSALAIASLPVAVLATVGGPTTLYNFSYNPLDESVYYVKQNYSGKGCPPELERISLATGEVTVVRSCDDGFAAVGGEYEASSAIAAIQEITKGFKPLTVVSLPANGIAATVELEGPEHYPPLAGYESDGPTLKWNRFTLSFGQDSRTLGRFPVTGCYPEQPFALAGYSIPGFEKKIVALLSAKGDCFEGGYVAERLLVVGNLTHLDKTATTNLYKDSSELVPDEGTLVVFASSVDGATEEQLDPEPAADTGGGGDEGNETEPRAAGEPAFRVRALLLAALVSGLVGLCLGALIFKKKLAPNNQAKPQSGSI